MDAQAYALRRADRGADGRGPDGGGLQQFQHRHQQFGCRLIISGRTGLLRPTSAAPVSAKAGSADDIGITPTTIRIAMIADVDTTLVPGLFQKSVNAVKAWAGSVNASGGLDGRKVVVGGQVRAIVSGRVPTRAELDRKVSFTVRLLVDGLRSRRDDTEKAP